MDSLSLQSSKMELTAYLVHQVEGHPNGQTMVFELLRLA